ncbi:malonyl-CoA decarboxylase [Paracraurococcus ruber]|uniref:Malonyl-CoA decarboxylase n=1 Tax=Paracraurococcus ruber TaxID=77675 RepID=A0ABS1D8V5_9PROT|nr:malonyl-CoA decarboxylase [Paracraurococcus ruber]MBK1662299.1 malonyl-CoA decarboxylase [Paracraurococcus ruber]TDG08664.1 malonyl-CoA decarboxylase [Paracraurococcus ruber]
MSDLALETGLLDRALRRVTSLWRDMAERVVGGEAETIADQMRACLDGRGGEVSARNRAARLAQAYLALDPAGRAEFLLTLAGFDADDAALARAVERLGAAADPAGRAIAKAALRRALEAPRVRLLTQFTTIPDGMRFLVELRAELLQLMERDPLLQALETDLKNLLASWFDVGFLELRRIDWNSPAALLEKLVRYEAVHRIRTWRDLKNRLDSDRRCYAFFHPRMPEEPLIFVEVALVQGMAASVQKLLDEKAPVQDPRGADTAIFYSINNCQRGLDGISFGNFLIKRVVALLGEELANLKSFATLSPIPGFRRWLQQRAADRGTPLLTEEEALSLRAAAPAQASLPAPASGGAASALVPAEHASDTLLRILGQRGWYREEAVAKAMEPVLLRLCAGYLLNEGNPRSPKRARDPVAHFHLSNGARVERINARADISEKGLKESAGLMVNYLYDPARIEEHHEEYVGEGRRPAATAIRRLVRNWPVPPG